MLSSAIIYRFSSRDMLSFKISVSGRLPILTNIPLQSIRVSSPVTVVFIIAPVTLSSVISSVSCEFQINSIFRAFLAVRDIFSLRGAYPDGERE